MRKRDRHFITIDENRIHKPAKTFATFRYEWVAYLVASGMNAMGDWLRVDHPWRNADTYCPGRDSINAR